MNPFNDLKLALIALNSNRTMPDDLIYCNEKYWSQCAHAFYDNFSDEREEFRKTYKYEWFEYSQNKWGVWRETGLSLETDKDLRN